MNSGMVGEAGLCEPLRQTQPELLVPGSTGDVFDLVRSTPRVALIVPPSRRPILRAYYCTSTSKGSYYWPQVDLWIQAAYLQSVAEVHHFDGGLLSKSELLDRLDGFAPQLAVIMVGGFSHQEDRTFAEFVTARYGIPWVATGEAVLFDRTYWYSARNFLGRLTNFAADGLYTWLSFGEAGEGFVPTVAGPPSTTRRPRELRWGAPPNWSLHGYRFPMLGDPVAVTLTTFGCPFACSYCNHNNSVLGARNREIDDLLFELDVLAERGVRYLYFRDVNFGGTQIRAKRILREMARRQYRFAWSTFLRPELIDEEMADLLHEAGCRQVQMGVETVNQQVLKDVRRGGRKQLVDDAFRHLEQRKIRRGAHFVLGLPGESEVDIYKTITWARRLDPDYAAYNIGVVRAGTQYHGANKETGDCSATHGDLLGGLSRRELLRLRRLAIWKTYFRLRYFMRIARVLVREPHLCFGVIRDGFAVIRRELSWNESR